MYRCKTLCSALLLLLLSLPLWAANDEANRNPNDPLDQGGETCATAVAITTIPFCDTGTTSGHVNDYPVTCNTGSAAPDVVYTLTPPVTSILSFSLCGSPYNTALTIWRGCPTSGGVLVCCSDNVCGDDACCSGVTLLANTQYFVVVDGGSTAPNSGNYVFNVVQGQACPETPCAQDTCPFPSRDFEPINDACGPNIPNVACGDRLCGEISTTADRDWYHFSFTQFPCSDVRINVFGDDTPGHWPEGQGLNPKVSLWTGDCLTMVAQDDDGGIGLDAVIDSLCTRAGSYYILVEGVGSIGPYELAVTCTGCDCPSCLYPDGDLEPNNACLAGGSVLTCGDTICGNITPGQDGQDYYYLDIQGPGCQNVTVDVFGNDTPGYFPFGQGLNPQVFIINVSCDSTIAFDGNSGAGNDARIDSLCLRPGIYRLYVQGQPQNQSFGPYVVAVSCTPCECPNTCDYPNRDNEALNNQCGTFNPPMVCGDTLCGDITTPNDVDWYLLTVVGAGLQRVTIDVFGDDTPGWYPFGQGLDPMVRIVGVGCTWVFGVDTASGIGEDARLEVCLPQGSYNIQVQQEDFTSGPYILATSCAPCDTCPWPNNDIEPINNQCGTFDPRVECGQSYCGAIQGAAAPDHDWYLIQLEFCTQLIIDVLGNDTDNQYPFGQGLDPAVEVWDSDCQTLIGQDSDGGIGEDSRLITACLEPGFYFIHVYGELATQGPYILAVGCTFCDCRPPCEITCPPQAILENEPCPSFIDTTDGGCNTTPHRFLPIGCGDTYCGTGYSDPNYTDTDWYGLRVGDPSQVRLCVTSEFNGYLSIYRPGPSLDPCAHRDLLDCIYVVGCQGIQCISLCLPQGVYLVEFRPTGLEFVNCWDYALAAVCSPCEPTVCQAPDSLVIHYPDSMGVSDSLQNVALYWTPVLGATEYRIYRTSNNNSLNIVQPANYVASTTATQFLHEGVIINNGINEIWIYQVVAYCEANHPPCDVVPTVVMPQHPNIVTPRE